MSASLLFPALAARNPLTAARIENGTHLVRLYK